MDLPVFQCYEGCGGCCPDGTTDGPIADLTLPDIKSLYMLQKEREGIPPGEFVDNVVDFRLHNDGYFGLWVPVLASPCYYLNEDKGCEVFEDRPYVCRTFPEVLLLTDPPGITKLFIDCYRGRSLSDERKEEIEAMVSERGDLFAEVANYFRGIEVGRRVKLAVDYLVGRVVPIGRSPYISTINGMVENIKHFEDGTAGAIVEARMRLDERVMELLEGIDVGAEELVLSAVGQ